MNSAKNSKLLVVESVSEETTEDIVRTTLRGRTPTSDDLLMCNCASCNRPLLSTDEATQLLAEQVYPNPKARPQTIAGRILESPGWNRPYCHDCLHAVLAETEG